MIWLVIAVRFVKLIFAKHTGCAHTCTHAQAHAAGINSCVCVCVSSSECVRVCARVCTPQLCTDGWILLCLFKATTIKLQTLELNHKRWEILLLSQCLAQDCPAPYATRSDLDNQHEQYFQILRTFSSGNMQPPASISQTPDDPQKESFIFHKAQKIGGAYLI